MAVKNKGIEIWSNPILPYSLLVAPIFLEAPYLSTVWLVRIYVRGCIPKLYLVKAIMKVVRNTVEYVKYISIVTASFVHAVECNETFTYR